MSSSTNIVHPIHPTPSGAAGSSQWPEHDLSAYRELINERGESIRWWRGARCACYNAATGAHDTKCPVCGGTSVTLAEQDVSAYKAIVRSPGERTDFMQQGILLANDVVITTMPDEIPIGQNDIISLPVRAYRYSETITASGTTRDRLHLGPVVDMFEAKTLAARLTDAGYENDDIEKGYVTWTTPPNAGTIVSVTYHHTPLFVVLPDIGTVRRTIATGTLPQKVYARLKNPEGID